MEEEEIWSNHITFIVAEKLNSQFLLLYFRYMWVMGWLKRYMGRGGWQKMSEYLRMVERGLNCSKNRHILFERSLSRKNVINSSFRKHYCVLGLDLRLGLGLSLVEICYRSNVFLSKCRRYLPHTIGLRVNRSVIDFK